jgi:poly(beta-D-mannuronate) lyase
MCSTRRLLTGLLVLGISGASASAAEHRISSAEAFRLIAPNLQPGDAVILSDGVWRDQAVVIDRSGTQGRPITVRAESAGKVIFTGRSSMRVGGDFVSLSGIWFDKCAGSKDAVAITGSHGQVVDCAFTANDVKFYLRLTGQHALVERCYFAGKTSDSPTLQVEVGDEPNRTRIVRNHFGHRPPLRRNGGETIRIGYSHQSMKSSGTTVQENLFEECDGELEIISSKACDNVYRANTFRACAGTLTLRHGNRCVVEGNFFLGDGKRGSGGIRIIGEEHSVTNNYFEGLDRAAIWLTAGIVDSSLNGYFRADKCVVAFNTIFQARGAALELNAGHGSARRTLRPREITIVNNLIVGNDEAANLVIGDEGDRFSWLGNVVSGVTREATSGARNLTFAKVAFTRDEHGIQRPLSGLPAAFAQSTAAVSTDLDVPSRHTPIEVAAGQFSPGPARYRPLNAKDVGPSWMSEGMRISPRDSVSR